MKTSRVAKAVVLDHAPAARGFRHEAFLYGADSEYVSGTGAFVAAGLDAGEPVLVAVSAPKIDALRSRLGRDSGRVHFVEIPAVGANPARLTPLLRSFVAEFGRGGQPVRGVGEPIWPERKRQELDECHLHEALLNHAFGSAPGWLLCPYDTSALCTSDVDEARRTHPFVWERGTHLASAAYAAGDVSTWFSAPLSLPPPSAVVRDFVATDLAALRAFVASFAEHHGLAEIRAGDMVLAVSEAAGNSIRHGAGWGTLRLWATDGELISEVTDAGQIYDPLVGRSRPEVDTFTGRGLWIVNQLCDLVELRSTPAGTVVRMHVAR